MAKQASKPASRAAGRATGRAKAAPKPPPRTRSSAKGRPKATAPSSARTSKTTPPAEKKTTASSRPPTKAAKLQAAGKAITSGHGDSKTKGAAGRSPSGVNASAPARTPARPRPAKPEPVPAVRGQKKARGAKRVTFDRKTLATIKKSLEDQRKDLIEQLEDIEEAAFSPSQTEASSEAGFDEDYADAGTATFEREKDLSIANNINNLVVKIDKALDKIEQGSYGICENCGQPISADRLKALPHVLLCINCKKAEERR